MSESEKNSKGRNSPNKPSFLKRLWEGGLIYHTPGSPYNLYL